MPTQRLRTDYSSGNRKTRSRKRSRTLVLSSDLVQFYGKLGYFAAGSEKQWQLDAQDLIRIESEMNKEKIKWEKFQILPLDSFDRAKELYRVSPNIGPQRNFALYDELLTLPNTYAYAAYERKAGSIVPELKAYGVMGKARDLRDTISRISG